MTVILVCVRVDGPLTFPDNKVGRCDVCGAKVQYRPHAPKNCILRCGYCAVELIGPDDKVGTTPQMITDYKAYLRKQQQ